MKFPFIYIVWNWISIQKTIRTRITSYAYLSISHCICIVLHRHMNYFTNIHIYIYMYIHVCIQICYFMFNTFTYFFVYHCCFFDNSRNQSTNHLCHWPFGMNHIVQCYFLNHHLWIIFYLLIWDLFFIKDFERNDINHTNGQEMQ